MNANPTVFELQNANVIGEHLRKLVFVEMQTNSSEFGCYTTFKVASDAVPMNDELKEVYLPYTFYRDDVEEDVEKPLSGEELSELEFERQLAEGYVVEIDGYRIESFWVWDHDGFLAFRVFKDEKLVVGVSNSDCKKDYVWKWFNLEKTV